MPEQGKNKKKVDKAAIITGIYYGKYGVMSLPEDLYYATGRLLTEGIYKGYGVPKLEVLEDTKDIELVEKLRNNIYMFSAAKTFQQTMEMSEALIDDDGYRRSFADFKAEAEKIYDRFNGEDFDGEEMGSWLKTEYDTAVGQARMAEKWQSIQDNKADLPNLMYQTSGGEEVCEICGPLDGIIAPVDDDFWNDNYPENHFHCNCTVIQLDEDKTEELGGVDDEDDIKEWVAQSKEDKNNTFNNNVGKSGQVFKDEGKDKHPYFIIPKEYKEFAKLNFNLPIPKKD